MDSQVFIDHARSRIISHSACSDVVMAPINHACRYLKVFQVEVRSDAFKQLCGLLNCLLIIFGKAEGKPGARVSKKVLILMIENNPVRSLRFHGRPLEIDALVASVAEMGRQVGVPTPTIETVLALARMRARTAK